MEDAKYTCYFCGETIERPARFGMTRCDNHIKPVVLWYDNNRKLSEISFNTEYLDKPYHIDLYLPFPTTTIIQRAGVKLFQCSSIIDLTPENIDRKLPMILTFG